MERYIQVLGVKYSLYKNMKTLSGFLLVLPDPMYLYRQAIRNAAALRLLKQPVQKIYFRGVLVVNFILSFFNFRLSEDVRSSQNKIPYISPSSLLHLESEGRSSSP